MIDAMRNQPIVAWRKVGSADAGEVVVGECIREIAQPVHIGPGIVIGVRNDLAGRGFEARVGGRR